MLRCNYCGYYTNKKYNLNRHLIYKHNQIPNEWSVSKNLFKNHNNQKLRQHRYRKSQKISDATNDFTPMQNSNYNIGTINVIDGDSGDDSDVNDNLNNETSLNKDNGSYDIDEVDDHNMNNETPLHENNSAGGIDDVVNSNITNDDTINDVDGDDNSGDFDNNNMNSSDYTENDNSFVDVGDGNEIMENNINSLERRNYMINNKNITNNDNISNNVFMEDRNDVDCFHDTIANLNDGENITITENYGNRAQNENAGDDNSVDDGVEISIDTDENSDNENELPFNNTDKNQRKINYEWSINNSSNFFKHVNSITEKNDEKSQNVINNHNTYHNDNDDIYHNNNDNIYYNNNDNNNQTLEQFIQSVNNIPHNEKKIFLTYGGKNKEYRKRISFNDNILQSTYKTEVYIDIDSIFLASYKLPLKTGFYYLPIPNFNYIMDQNLQITTHDLGINFSQTQQNLKDILHFEFGVIDSFRIYVFLPNMSKNIGINNIVQWFTDYIALPLLYQLSNQHEKSHFPSNYEICRRNNVTKNQKFTFPTYYINYELMIKWINNIYEHFKEITGEYNNIFFLICSVDMKLKYFKKVITNDFDNNSSTLINNFINYNNILDNQYLNEYYDYLIVDFGIEMIPLNNYPRTFLWYATYLNYFCMICNLKLYASYYFSMNNEIKGANCLFRSRERDNFGLMMINFYNLEKEEFYAKSRTSGISNFSQRDFYYYYGKYESAFKKLILIHNNMMKSNHGCRIEFRGIASYINELDDNNNILNFLNNILINKMLIYINSTSLYSLKKQQLITYNKLSRMNEFKPNKNFSHIKNYQHYGLFTVMFYFIYYLIRPLPSFYKLYKIDHYDIHKNIQYYNFPYIDFDKINFINRSNASSTNNQPLTIPNQTIHDYREIALHIWSNFLHDIWGLLQYKSFFIKESFSYNDNDIFRLNNLQLHFTNYKLTRPKMPWKSRFKKFFYISDIVNNSIFKSSLKNTEYINMLYYYKNKLNKVDFGNLLNQLENFFFQLEWFTGGNDRVWRIRQSKIIIVQNIG
jgi:hypothetical protein